MSITRDVRTAFSDALPSLLLNPPGIFPTEYNFSSYSTESGKKSIPSLGFSEAVHVESTVVSPYLINAAPFACAATLLISTVSILPAISFWYLLNVLWKTSKQL